MISWLQRLVRGFNHFVEAARERQAAQVPDTIEGKIAHWVAHDRGRID